MLFFMGAMKGYSAEAGWLNATTRFNDAIGMALLFWPFVSLALYSVVPRRYGDLFMDSCNLCWGICLSFIANK